MKRNLRHTKRGSKKTLNTIWPPAKGSKQKIKENLDTPKKIAKQLSTSIQSHKPSQQLSKAITRRISGRLHSKGTKLITSRLSSHQGTQLPSMKTLMLALLSIQPLRPTNQDPLISHSLDQMPVHSASRQSQTSWPGSPSTPRLTLKPRRLTHLMSTLQMPKATAAHNRLQ